jgi:hypothetical protein
MNGWYGFDLDGTLATYDGWKGAEHVGEPTRQDSDVWIALRKHLAAGDEVRIFTARAYSDGTRERAIECMRGVQAIEQWCLKHMGKILPVTCVKDFGMISFYDDRCVQIEPNTGRRMDGAR